MPSKGGVEVGLAAESRRPRDGTVTAAAKEIEDREEVMERPRMNGRRVSRRGNEARQSEAVEQGCESVLTAALQAARILAFGYSTSGVRVSQALNYSTKQEQLR